MRHIIYIFLITLISIISGRSYAQGLGLQLPALKFKTWKDGKEEIFQTNDLKGKLVILDFWNIRCGSCISAMPKMDSLQEEFGDKVKILLVTKNTKAQADKLFDRIGTKAKKAAFVYGDSIFNAMFKHQGEPFHVWIDTTGKAIFQTAGYNTNRKTINAYLSKDTKFRLPHEAGINVFDRNQSLAGLIEQPGIDKVLGYSIFSRNIGDISLGGSGKAIEKDSVSGSIRKLKLVNWSIANMLRFANHDMLKNIPAPDYNEKDMLPANRIIYEGPDPHFFSMPKNDELKADWIANHLFCYEIYSPTGREIYRIMRSDLARYSDYDTKVQQRKTRCLVLVRFGNSKQLNDSFDNGEKQIIFTKSDLTIKNAGIFDLLAILSQSNTHLVTPFVDGTGFNGKLSLVFEKNLRDLEYVRSELRKHGLDLLEETKAIDMLVVTDKKGSGN